MMKYILLAALASSIVGWAYYKQQGVEIRKNAAADWSVDGTRFVATGMDNETLVLVIADEDPVMCDVYVDNIATGKDAQWLIKSRGFTTVKCLDRVLDLK